ncbi:cyclin-T2 [Rhipicephalus sanguineus]|uniref:cyclin-T2 n=1 Tax=Rhipicephalus sanguineus TaxID=34632 RepID=UPI0018954DE5|nr:cyclin-T2 [Rhipicephalus sanguineus]
MAAAERWYFTKEQLALTPSRKCGLDADKELSYRQQAANLIQDMGQRLQVTQLCINTAIVYMHRFYYYHSFTKFHRNSIAACALFLAAKVEEQPRKLEHVIKVAHMCLHRDAPPLNPASEAYQEQALELVLNENMMLQTLGFDIGIEHPHTHVVNFCQLVRASKDLAQTSYFMATNSLHLTMMCLQYKPRVVACLCIHLACKWSNWEIPKSSENKDWFWYVDQSCTAELLEELTSEFLAILDKCPSRLKRKIMSIGAGSGGSSSTAAPTPVASAPSTSGSSRREAHAQQKREERAAAAASHEPSTSSEAHASSERQPASSSHGSSRKPPSDPTLHRNAKVPPHHGPAQPSPGLVQLQTSNQGAEHVLSPGKRKAPEGSSSHGSQPLSLDAYRDKRCRQKGQPKPQPPPSDRSGSHHGATSHPPHQAPSSHSQSRHHQPHLEPTPDVSATTAPLHHPPTATATESTKPSATQVKQEHTSDDASGFNFNFGAQFGGDGGDSSIDSFSFGLDGPDIMPAISPLQFDADDRSNSQDVLMTLSHTVPPPPSVPTLPAEESIAPPKVAAVPPPAVPPAKVEPRTPPLPPPKVRPPSPPPPQKPVPATPPLPPQKSRPSTPPLPPQAAQLLPPPPPPAAPAPTAAPLPAPVADKPEVKAEVKPEAVAAPPVKDKEKERSERKERKERHKHKHSSSERSRNKHSSPGKHSGGEKTSEGKSHGDRVPDVGAHHAASNAVDAQPAVNQSVDGAPAADSDRKVERNGISKHDRKSSGSSKSESSRKEKSERREKERREASREENGSRSSQPSAGGGLKITISKEKLQQSGSGLTGSPPREALKIKIPKLKIVPPTPTPPPPPPADVPESGKGPHTPPPPPPSTGLKLKISKERLNSGRKRDRRSDDGEHRARSPKSRKVSVPVPPPPPPPPGPSYPAPPVPPSGGSANHVPPQFHQGYVPAPQFSAPPPPHHPPLYFQPPYGYPPPPPPMHMAPGAYQVPQYFGIPPPPPPVDPPLPKELPPPPPPPPSE